MCIVYAVQYVCDDAGSDDIVACVGFCRVCGGLCAYFSHPTPGRCSLIFASSLFLNNVCAPYVPRVRVWS